MIQAVLLVHIAAGSIAILAGAGAAFARKGGVAHRLIGRVFCGAMVIMAVLGAYLALFTTPKVPGGTPPQASATIAILSLYLVSTAGLTVWRRPGLAGWPERSALLAALTIATTLLTFGGLATQDPAMAKLAAPYFVFAGFAAFAAAGDLRLVMGGGITGAARIARHLWRMCFAWFFASAFFFIGQQKVMPASFHGSPLLALLAAAPLVVMAIWLVRITATRATAGKNAAGLLRRGLDKLAFRSRTTPCPGR